MSEVEFADLIERARYIGVGGALSEVEFADLIERARYPIDVFSVATEISEHPDAVAGFDALVSLVSDPENYFTRWAAIRAIRQMGAANIQRARGQLEEQAKCEDYELAAKEISAALSQLEPE